MPEHNVNLIRRWFDEVWNYGRIETIYELMAPNAVGIGEAGGDVTIRGPQQFQAFVENLRGAFPDINLTVDDAFASGDKVVARWSATMTHKGDQLGIPASGKQVKITGISIAQIANGQIIAGWDNWDEMRMMRAIGAVKVADVTLAAASS